MLLLYSMFHWMNCNFILDFYYMLPPACHNLLHISDTVQQHLRSGSLYLPQQQKNAYAVFTKECLF